MPLDLSLPIELDDGTPVTLYSVNSNGRYFYVRTPKYHRTRRECDGENVWMYEMPSGIFSGGTAERHYVIRNSGPREPEEYENWFV